MLPRIHSPGQLQQEDSIMISPDIYVIPASSAIGRTIDDEAVLVLPEQGQVKVLNEVGARIWALADGTRTVRDIVDTICTEYEVEPAQAEADTLDFVARLVERGMVSLSAEPAQTQQLPTDRENTDRI
jgi:glycerol-3-phosphate O-acyltransferase